MIHGYCIQHGHYPWQFCLAIDIYVFYFSEDVNSLVKELHFIMPGTFLKFMISKHLDIFKLYIGFKLRSKLKFNVRFSKERLVVIIMKYATTSKVFWSWLLTDFDFLSPMFYVHNSSVVLNSNFYPTSEMHSTKTNKFESNFRVRNHFEIWNSEQRKPTIIHFKYWLYAHY